MASRLRPCSAFRRRALARISSTPMPAVSSMKSCASDKRLERVRDLAVLALPDLAAQQAIGVDLRLRREHAHEQRLLRHFEAEEPGHAAVRGHVLADVQHQAGLAHRRAGGDDHQVAGLQAARLAVDVVEAGRDAGDVALVLEQLLDLREALLDQLAHRQEAGLDAIVGHREDRALGVVEDEVGFLVGLVGVREDLVGRVDQRPQRRLLLDDLRVVLDVGRARHAVDQRGDVGRAADFVQLAGAFERLPSA